MSLTLGLTILGALVIAALIAHGVWTARKLGVKRASASAAGPASERLEPGLQDAAAPASPPAESSADASPEEALALPRRRPAPRLDALIDAIAPMRLESPVTSELVLTHLPPTRRAGTKPFLVEGLNAETGEWESPMPDRRYGELQAGVQMANRAGALNEIEYSEFVQKIERLAEAVGAVPDFPDMLDVVARARELDAFAGQHDAQLAVQLRARDAGWSAGYIQQQAARHGFVAGALPGRLVLPAAEDGAPPVLTLAFDPQAALADDPNRAVVREATLAFDVPQTDLHQQPFSSWQSSALAIAADMEADIVDDAGQVLSASSFAQIGAALGRLYEELATRDLAAGSSAARRLFS